MQLLNSLLLFVGLLLLFGRHVLKLAWPFLREQPSHVIAVLLFRWLNQVPPFKVFDVILFEIVQLVMIFLVLLKPKLHQRRSVSALLVQWPPPSWFLELVNGYVVLAYCLVLPLEWGGVDLIPEVKADLEHHQVVHLLARGSNAYRGLIGNDGLIP